MGALTIWRVSDGRRGHDSQSNGLVAALARQARCDIHELPALAPWRAALYWLRGSFPPGRELPDPRLIIGAGHGTHATLLAARRARGGRTIVLMRPTLPGACFDLCIVPGHDRPPACGGPVLRTLGPLHELLPGARHDAARGLVLIGGPARHYTWDADALLAQVRAIVAAPDCAWTLGDSPRTPPAFRARLRELRGPGYVPWDAVDRDWLPAQLAGAGTAWVSTDSLSMIFEALGSGCAVGVLDLPVRRPDRVTRAVADLVARGLVTSYADWQQGRRPRPAQPPLREADRCATEVLRRFAGAAP